MDFLKNSKYGFNGFTLKWIAVITMIIDHVGMGLFPQYPIMRIIGRFAFPIYCFLLVEGAMHTSNKRKYLTRLLLFALISEIPFNLVLSGTPFYLTRQNIFFTLFLGLAAVFLLESKMNKVFSLSLAVILCFVARFMHVDYGGAGVLFILIFYIFRNYPLMRAFAFVIATMTIYQGIQWYAILALIPISCYNGKQGPKMKYFFYLVYPIHLLILYCLMRWT